MQTRQYDRYWILERADLTSMQRMFLKRVFQLAALPSDWTCSRTRFTNPGSIAGLT